MAPLTLIVVELGPILARLAEMEQRIMSATSEGFDRLDASVAAAKERATADIGHVRELLEAALAANPDQTAEIERLRAEISSVLDRLASATGAVDAIDVDPSFPVTPPVIGDEAGGGITDEDGTPIVDEPPTAPV